MICCSRCLADLPPEAFAKPSGGYYKTCTDCRKEARIGNARRQEHGARPYRQPKPKQRFNAAEIASELWDYETGQREKHELKVTLPRWEGSNRKRNPTPGSSIGQKHEESQSCI